MKWTEIKKIIDKNFKPEDAIKEDVIGELVTIPEDINKIYTCLDITFEAIEEAINNECELIVSHHPLYWGTKAEQLKLHPNLSKKISILKKNNIGVYTAHTNADISENSISLEQGEVMGMSNLKNDESKTIVNGQVDPVSFGEYLKKIKERFAFSNELLRTNVDDEFQVNKISIISGAGFSLIHIPDSETLYIIGEMKYHEWIQAKEQELKVVEITHNTEEVFVDIVNLMFSTENVDIIKSKGKKYYEQK